AEALSLVVLPRVPVRILLPFARPPEPPCGCALLGRALAHIQDQTAPQAYARAVHVPETDPPWRGGFLQVAEDMLRHVAGDVEVVPRAGDHVIVVHGRPIVGLVEVACQPVDHFAGSQGRTRRRRGRAIGTRRRESRVGCPGLTPAGHREIGASSCRGLNLEFWNAKRPTRLEAQVGRSASAPRKEEARAYNATPPPLPADRKSTRLNS